jgi:hypothetical protein
VLSFNKPILFKNLYCSVRIQPITRALPEALFIVVKRGLIDNGQSILESRKNIKNTYEWWFSLEPPEVDKLKCLPPYKQVVEQIRSIYHLIDKERDVVGKTRFLEIEYESFCEDTYSVLECIKSFIKQHGTELAIRGEVQSMFSVNSRVKIDKELYRKMCGYVKQVMEF